MSVWFFTTIDTMPASKPKFQPCLLANAHLTKIQIKITGAFIHTLIEYAVAQMSTRDRFLSHYQRSKVPGV